MPYTYFNRDISWLSFNYRVLEEAYDDSIPLYERIKFLAIYSNNLEEFYRVRVSYYRSLLKTFPPQHPKLQEVQPESILHQINTIVSKQQKEFHELLNKQVIPELAKEGIHLLQFDANLTPEQEETAKSIFRQDILTSLQPVLLVKHRVKPFLKTGHVYLILELYTKTKTFKSYKLGSRPQYGLIKLPTDHGVSRFIELGEQQGNQYLMFLEDVIMRYIHKLFTGYHVESWYSIKVTRDADLEYEDYDGEDLIEVIENISTTRAIGEPNRFQYDASMPENMLNFLIQTFEITNTNLVKGGRTHNFRDFFTFPNPKSPALENPKFTPLRVADFENSKSILALLNKKEIMLHFPYQSFDYFINFLQEAAINPNVVEIQTTQYRVASKSAVVDALIDAALNGKKVTVFVELKARFDEETNLQYARIMKQAGIKIIYSIPGLKVHSKLALVTKKNDDGGTERFAFMGTGNFNEKTAKLYGDHGFFTTDNKIIYDLVNLFCLLEDRTFNTSFEHILVPNYNMTETYTKLIDKEIKQAKKGKKAYIILKMNGLEDPVMIKKLYEASEQGVKIDLLVRGVCRVVPNQKFSKNIRTIRIVDKFLEHARVFYFYQNGSEVLYMGSADWMKRNLYKRIECVFPIYNKKIKTEVLDILKIQLSDNVKARIIDENMDNTKVTMGDKPVRSQVEIYEYLKNKSES